MRSLKISQILQTKARCKAGSGYDGSGFGSDRCTYWVLDSDFFHVVAEKEDLKGQRDSSMNYHKDDDQQSDCFRVSLDGTSGMEGLHVS